MSLQLGSVTIPLEATTSFWIQNSKAHEITFYCREEVEGESFWTIFHLFLENADKVQQYISQLKQNPKMCAIFYIRSITPIISGIPEKSETGQIGFPVTADFEFDSLDDLQSFATYAPPLLTQFFCKAVGIKGNNVPYITLQYKKLVDTSERIDIAVQEMMNSLTVLEINPPSPSPSTPLLPPAHDFDWNLEHVRAYEFNQGSFSEYLALPSNVLCKLPVSDKDVEQWIQNPTLQKEKRMKQKMEDAVKQIVNG